MNHRTKVPKPPFRGSDQKCAAENYAAVIRKWLTPHSRPSAYPNRPDAARKNKRQRRTTALPRRNARRNRQDVHEEAPVRLKPRANPSQQFAPVHQVREHRHPQRQRTPAEFEQNPDKPVKHPAFAEYAVIKARFRHEVPTCRWIRGVPSFFLSPAVPYWRPKTALRNG